MYKQVKEDVGAKVNLLRTALLVIKNTTDDKEGHWANALTPILVTFSGIEMEVRPLLANTELPIVNSDVGNSIVRNAVQPSNAPALIFVTPDGRITCPFASGVNVQSASTAGNSANESTKRRDIARDPPIIVTQTLCQQENARRKGSKGF
jgi:hypothetical protein